MKRYARAERQTLADLLDRTGPDAPTLCKGWTTRDLAAHLVVRERRPDAAIGLVIPALRRHGDRVRAARARTPYPQLVDLVRQPPWWSPVSNPLIDPVANGLEMFVHHEDVLRAQPDWRPRELPTAYLAAIWAEVRSLARIVLRSYPAAVLLDAPGWGQTRAGAGGPKVRVVGAPPELLLVLVGRQRAALVELDGPAEQTERLRRANLGI
ncbi:TIGR03085 family metal-binding protein [Pilimelia columellifera]|uniref:TIGR03085 family metal-binding protein n=1 Tax=Pilimelia columellifera subsp. columellifera TaxID=706583 RepID=A0ABN3NA64_9ACTN